MITDSMRLNSVRDASVWASQLGLQSDTQEQRIAVWIWNNRPAIGCTYDEHPISALSDAQFWRIAEGEAPQIYLCLRCGHEWAGRGGKRPGTCPNPKCRSPYWDKPRGQQRGRPAK